MTRPFADATHVLADSSSTIGFVRVAPSSVSPQARGFGISHLMRALILSWEYPPLIEGGLARHVRKLAETLPQQDVEIHVLARGREEDPAEEERGGVTIHRVREPNARATSVSSSPGSSG